MDYAFWGDEEVKPKDFPTLVTHETGSGAIRAVNDKDSTEYKFLRRGIAEARPARERYHREGRTDMDRTPFNFEGRVREDVRDKDEAE